jgi:CDP-glucose 4,6-dehydratase
VDSLKLKRYFSGKKVFITGITGFKGTWLARTLKILGAEVFGCGLAPTDEHSLFWLENVPSFASVNFVDLRDYNSLHALLSLQKYDCVFHLAAEPLVKRCYENPFLTYEVNTLGTAAVLEILRKLSYSKPIIIITTDKVYKNSGNGLPFTETDQLGGDDPYSSSKASADIIASSYSASYFSKYKNITICRAGNVIGGGDFSEDRIVTDLFDSMQTQSPIKLRYPNAVRPWQHVIEPTVAYLALAENSNKNKHVSYNIGPELESCITVDEFSRKFSNYTNKNVTVQHTGAPKKHKEATLLRLNCNRIKEEDIWSPRYDINEAIQKTAMWYDDHLDGKKTNISDEIEEYLFGKL